MQYNLLIDDIKIRNQKQSDEPVIQELIAGAFHRNTIVREVRAVDILRKNVQWLQEFCFVAEYKKSILGVVRCFQVVLPSGTAVPMLGPIAVKEGYRCVGMGRALIEKSLSIMRKGEKGVLIIGDKEYYKSYGFTEKIVQGIYVQGAIKPLSFMGLEFENNILKAERGQLRHG